jgi:nitrite reductase/ring-hydroxylating ferredoxin subunit
MIRICASYELPEGQSRGFSVAGLALLAVRRNGQAYLYRNRCPHRGIGLEWQPDRFLDSSGSLIQCATHGALFLIESGECVAGPCAGQSLQALDCREDQTGLWVQLPGHEAAAEHG